MYALLWLASTFCLGVNKVNMPLVVIPQLFQTKLKAIPYPIVAAAKFPFIQLTANFLSIALLTS